jgi:hypothetical protein
VREVSEERKEEVRAFLRTFKKAALRRGIDFIPRREFLEARAWLGLTIRNCRDEILSLTVDDYCEGPSPDRDRQGHVWIFGKKMSGTDVYIKLKLALVEGQTIAKCLSFHPTGYPLCFPFKEKKEGEEK